jgi:hypothetical protein
LTDTQNPFAIQDVLGKDPVQEVREAIASSPFEEPTKPVTEAVTAYQRLVHAALGTRQIRRKRHPILEELKAYGHRLLQSVVSYAKRAIELASHKFVIELCAMVMTALLGALSKKGYRASEVSTGDVYYRPAGVAAPQAAQQPGYRGTDHHNPFADFQTSSAWR